MVSPLHCSNCQRVDFDRIIDGESWLLRCRDCGHVEGSVPVISAPGSDRDTSPPVSKTAPEGYPAPADFAVVSLGAVVSLTDERGQSRNLQIINQEHYQAAKRAHPDSNFVTHDSPMGVGLTGRQVGDLIHVKLPAGLATFKIVSLEYPQNSN